MAAEYSEYLTLENWLLVVAGLSIFGSFQGYFSATVIKERQFSKAPEQVSPLCRRLFGAWTLVASIVRLTTAISLFRNNGLIVSEGLYFVCFCTFLVAFLVYFTETFIFHTIPITNALAPFFVAGLSIGWMYPTVAPMATSFLQTF